MIYNSWKDVLFGIVINKHLMTGPKGNSEFCFPKTLNVSRGEAWTALFWSSYHPPPEFCTVSVKSIAPSSSFIIGLHCFVRELGQLQLTRNRTKVAPALHDTDKSQLLWMNESVLEWLALELKQDPKMRTVDFRVFISFSTLRNQEHLVDFEMHLCYSCYVQLSSTCIDSMLWSDALDEFWYHLRLTDIILQYQTRQLLPQQEHLSNHCPEVKNLPISEQSFLCEDIK